MFPAWSSKKKSKDNGLKVFALCSMLQIKYLLFIPAYALITPHTSILSALSVSDR